MISTERGNGAAANEPAGDTHRSDHATAALPRSLINPRRSILQNTLCDLWRALMKINQRLDLLGDVLGIWFCAKSSPMLPFWPPALARRPSRYLS